MTIVCQAIVRCRLLKLLEKYHPAGLGERPRTKVPQRRNAMHMCSAVHMCTTAAAAAAAP